MRILVATDACEPQVNGVVTTYRRLAAELPAFGATLTFLTPDAFSAIPCPTYPEIALALPGRRTTDQSIRAAAPDAIHIATEGPVGWSVRRWCRDNGVPFTTSFHTRFPEYISARFGLPERWSYAALRAFHNAGQGIMVAAPSLAAVLAERGFKRILPWTRGVALAEFYPRPVRLFGEGPVFLYVGRVAIEKNLAEFLNLRLPGCKVIVGDGPQRAELEARYPDVHFTGRLFGTDLAEAYASADVFVFPSRTDTFGIVMIEAMATGLPIAAYPVTGPRDVVTDGVSGILSHDLAEACQRALTLDRNVVRAAAGAYSWSNAAQQFLANIATATAARPERTFARANRDAPPARRGVWRRSTRLG